MSPRGPSRLAPVALFSLALAAAGAYFAGLAFDVPALRLVAKPVPAVVLALWVARRNRELTGSATASGLLLSALGDALLERGLFVPGLLAFLAAHLAYAVAFSVARPRLLPLRALPFLAFGVSVFLLLREGLGALAVPVGVYVAVICTMMWRAAAGLGGTASAPSAQWLGLAGALAFAASDTLIAFDRFAAPIAGASLPIMLLYWLGQWGIAAAAPVPVCSRAQVSTP